MRRAAAPANSTVPPAVSLARRAGKTEDIILMRNLAYAR
ncbi:hypothetical protein ABH924_003429 [Arthrobacter sp. GAS37]